MQLWQDTDLLIGVGSRLELQYMRWMGMDSFHDHPSADGARVIRIDIDPAEMQRFRPDVGVVADSAEAVSALIEKITARGFRAGDTQRIADAKAAARKNIEEIQPQIAYLDVIRDVMPRDGRFVGELCQVGFASYFGFEVYEPRTYISEGFQGTLGFGFPTALGVKAALPDKAVVSVTGDGGFMFGVQELATAVQYDIGLVTIVFNNSSYGNVRRDQQQRFDANLIGADLVNPDFMKFADSFGVSGHRVHSPGEMRGVLERAIDNDAPSLIEVVIERGSEASPWKYIMR